MMESPDQIVTWLIDDDVSICASFKEAIQQHASYIKVTTYPGCEAAFEALRKEQCLPDVILLDIHMPRMSGIDAIPHFKSLTPGSAIIMLTASFMDNEIMKAFTHGAEGYLLKTVQIGQVVDSIRAAMRGGVPMDPLVARKILEMHITKDSEGPRAALTEIEKDIVRLLIEGSTLRQVADVLSLDYSTVNSHLAEIQTKLGVRTRSGIVMKAQKEKLLGQ